MLCRAFTLSFLVFLSLSAWGAKGTREEFVREFLKAMDFLFEGRDDLVNWQRDWKPVVRRDIPQKPPRPSTPPPRKISASFSLLKRLLSLSRTVEERMWASAALADLCYEVGRYEEAYRLHEWMVFRDPFFTVIVYHLPTPDENHKARIIGVWMTKSRYPLTMNDALIRTHKSRWLTNVYFEKIATKYPYLPQGSYFGTIWKLEKICLLLGRVQEAVWIRMTRRIFIYRYPGAIIDLAPPPPWFEKGVKILSEKGAWPPKGPFGLEEVDGWFMVDVNEAAKRLGFEVFYEKASGQISLVKGARVLSLRIGHRMALLGSRSLKVGIGPLRKNGNILLPLRLVAEVFGWAT